MATTTPASLPTVKATVTDPNALIQPPPASATAPRNQNQNAPSSSKNPDTGEQCTSPAQQGELCMKHGPKKIARSPRRKKCRHIEGCTNKSQRGGLCTRHWYKEHTEGGTYKLPHRKLCSVQDCTNQARRAGVCTRHGATQKKRKRTFVDANGEIKRYKRECKEEGCTKYAVRGGVCMSHGGTQTPRKLCNFILTNPYTGEEERCTSGARRRGGLCLRHGGPRQCTFILDSTTGERCTLDDVQGGLCLCHGGTNGGITRQTAPPKKRCSVQECTNLARKGGVCTKHGAKQIQSPRRICNYEGCGRFRRGTGMMCNVHGKLQEAIIGNSIFLPLPFVLQKEDGKDGGKEKVSSSSSEEGKDDNGLGNEEGKMPLTCQFITEEKDEEKCQDSDVEIENVDGSSDSDGDAEDGSGTEEGGGDSSVDEEGIHYGNDKVAAEDKGQKSEQSDSHGSGFPYGNNVVVAKGERKWFNLNADDNGDGLEFDEQPMYLTQKREGSKPRLRPKCKVKGCTNRAVGSVKGPRLCIRHGGENKHPRCTIEGCTKFAQRKSGFCWRHGKEAAGEKPIRCPRLTDPNNRPRKVPHPTRKFVYQCAEKGCTKQATGAGKCWAHGAKQYRKNLGRICIEEGCTNQVVNNGVCVKHGAVLKKCNYGDGGCANSAVSGCDLCALHGGVFKRRCKHEGCSRWRVEKGMCTLHGATMNKYRICKHEGCNRYRVKNGVCTLHGAEKVPKQCSHEGCTNQIQQGGLCTRHGAKRRPCGHQGGCTSLAQKGGLCKRHHEEGSSRQKPLNPPRPHQQVIL